MRDDSTPIGSREEAGDDAQRALANGDDGQIADVGAEHAEEVRGVDVNVETESVAGQQVQHLSHFCSYQSFLFFLFRSFFYIASPSDSSKHCW
jgi:hypothetical protein